MSKLISPDDLEHYTPEQTKAALAAVLNWMNAAERCRTLLNRFGEDAAGQRVQSIVEALDSVIEEALVQSGEHERLADNIFPLRPVKDGEDA